MFRTFRYTRDPFEAAEQVLAFSDEFHASLRFEHLAYDLAYWLSQFRERLRADGVDLEAFERTAGDVLKHAALKPTSASSDDPCGPSARPAADEAHAD